MEMERNERACGGPPSVRTRERTQEAASTSMQLSDGGRQSQLPARPPQGAPLSRPSTTQRPSSATKMGLVPSSSESSRGTPVTAVAVRHHSVTGATEAGPPRVLGPPATAVEETRQGVSAVTGRRPISVVRAGFVNFDDSSKLRRPSRGRLMRRRPTLGSSRLIGATAIADFAPVALNTVADRGTRLVSTTAACCDRSIQLPASTDGRPPTSRDKQILFRHIPMPPQE